MLGLLVLKTIEKQWSIAEVHGDRLEMRSELNYFYYFLNMLTGNEMLSTPPLFTILCKFEPMLANIFLIIFFC